MPATRNETRAAATGQRCPHPARKPLALRTGDGAHHMLSRSSKAPGGKRRADTFRWFFLFSAWQYVVYVMIRMSGIAHAVRRCGEVRTAPAILTPNKVSSLFDCAHCSDGRQRALDISCFTCVAGRRDFLCLGRNFLEQQATEWAIPISSSMLLCFNNDRPKITRTICERCREADASCSDESHTAATSTCACNASSLVV